MTHLQHRSVLYLEAIKRSVAEITSFDTPQPLLDHIVAAVQRELHFYVASIFRYDREAGLARLVAQEGQSAEPAPIGYTQPIDSGVVGHVLRTGLTVHIDDVRLHPSYVAPAGYAPAVTELCVPIMSDGQVWGVFNIESNEPTPFTHDDQMALEVIAAQLGSALHSLELRVELHTLVNDLSAQSQRQEQLLAEIDRLGTPIFPIFSGGLALPLIGTLDDARMARISEELLTAIQRTRSHTALLDVTGIAMIDHVTANHLLQLNAMTRLLGAELVLTGIRPDVAHAFTSLNADLSSLHVCQDFSSGLRYALQGGRGV
ncbi:GAF domain-containing protein [Chloroflexales bacterium ZM16-3]|nr:GAF domain-containing protein [Chloroflexales bacterium ZM16-3]